VRAPENIKKTSPLITSRRHPRKIQQYFFRLTILASRIAVDGDAVTARHETARKESAAQKCRGGNCVTWNQREKH